MAGLQHPEQESKVFKDQRLRPVEGTEPNMTLMIIKKEIFRS
jgi:hypothetical protein